MLELLALNCKFKDDLILVIRKRLVANLLLFAKFVPQDFLFDRVEDTLAFWLNHRNYIYRVSALQALATFITHFNHKRFADVLMDNLELLRSEGIVNVRINALKLLVGIAGDFDKRAWGIAAKALLDAYKNDDDMDVAHYKARVTELLNKP